VLDGALAERWFPGARCCARLLAATRDPSRSDPARGHHLAGSVLAGNVLRLANSAWYRITQDQWKRCSAR
jgi:hypothetical protein